MVLTLLDAGANVNGIDWQGRSVLIKAARRKVDPSVVSILLTHGADEEVKDNNGMTALISAALFNQTTTASLLLDYRATIEVQDMWGHTTLMVGTYNIGFSQGYQCQDFKWKMEKG